MANASKPAKKTAPRLIQATTIRQPRGLHLRNKSSLGTAQAKMHFSSLVDMIVVSERPVTITKRGKPVVQIVPIAAKPATKSIFGCMKGTAKATGDIVGPEPDEWEAMQ